MSGKMYKFEGEEFEVTEAGCSLEARLLGQGEQGVYGSVVPSNTHNFPFIGQLSGPGGHHISSGLASSVEEALGMACGYVLAYRKPDSEKACKDIKDFYVALDSNS